MNKPQLPLSLFQLAFEEKNMPSEKLTHHNPQILKNEGEVPGAAAPGLLVCQGLK